MKQFTRQHEARRKPVPHRFVLDLIADAAPVTRAMFGALAVYVGGKIVFILRDRSNEHASNGVWVAVEAKHESSLRADFPTAGLVRIMGKDIRGWLLLSSGSPDFEETATRACELVLKRDPRIGKIPPKQRRKAAD